MISLFTAKLTYLKSYEEKCTNSIELLGILCVLFRDQEINDLNDLQSDVVTDFALNSFNFLFQKTLRLDFF